jgi:hypothetical protein
MANTLRPGAKLTQAQVFAYMDAEFDRDPSQFLGPYKDPNEELYALYDAEWERAQVQDC